MAHFLARADCVVGIVRGRAELGPRALGHRSLIAYPANPAMKVMFNLIKGRQSFRPVSPLVPESACELFFGKNPFDHSGNLKATFVAVASIGLGKTTISFPPEPLARTSG